MPEKSYSFPNLIKKIAFDIQVVDKCSKGLQDRRNMIATDKLGNLKNIFPKNDFIDLYFADLNERITEWKGTAFKSLLNDDQFLQGEIAYCKKIIKLCNENYKKCPDLDLEKIEMGYVFFPEMLRLCLILLNSSTGGKAEIKAPIIGLFCILVKDSDVIPQRLNENVQSYCTRVCEEFNLPYSDRVRQNFKYERRNKIFAKVRNQILPRIDFETKEKIITFIEKHP